MKKKAWAASFVDNVHHRAETNAETNAKLLVRRYFLDKYHRDERPRVLDCCQAEGVLWTTLRREYDVVYLGVDRIAARGRLGVDSSRLLTIPGLPYDVIDVDTHGSPWRHWTRLLPNLVKPATVFLTLGRVGGLASIDESVIRSVGLARMRRAIPPALRWKLDKISVDACLATSYIYGVQIDEAQEVIPASTNARYFGIRLTPSA